MAQLNIYLAPDDTLKARLDQSALSLGTTPNTLARVVVDEFLESYVGIALEAETMKRHALASLNERLQHRSQTLGKSRFEAGSEGAEFRAAEDIRRKPRKRLHRRTLSRELVAPR